MPNAMTVLGSQLKEIWRHFGINQKVSTILGLLITVGLMGGLLYWSSRPDFRLLYAGLSLKDAASVREKLEDEKIPTTLKDSGRAIYVPAGDVYRARLLLAGEGLPKDTSTGFELFEQPKFGLTDFAQQVNYQRALQGELERTIASMKGIDSARVMLVLPKEKLFAAEAEKKASASILLTLSGGASIGPSQVQSIAQLVSSSVPGLSPAAVMVTDQNGTLLSQRHDSADEPLEQATEQLSAQERAEALLTRKAQDLLDKALGLGKSIVRVNVALDMSKIERRSETYDSENRVVRSETIESENTSQPGGSGGAVAGVVANIPVGSPNSGTVEQGMSRSKKENVRTEYAIPSDVQHVIQRGARIANLSVAVCMAKGAAARTPDELKKIEQMVKNAVGFVESDLRKDTIEVTEMEFAPPEPAVKAPFWTRLPVRLDTLGRGALAVIILLVIYRISRRVMSGLVVVQQEEAGVPIQNLTGEYAAGSTRAVRGEGRGGEATPLAEISRIAEQNPKAVAAWITSVTGS